MSERILKIVAAIALLDTDNPSHFLKDGVTPEIGILEELTGFEDITAAERDKALNQVSDPESSAPLVVEGEKIRIIGKTVVRVKEGEEQLAWGSKFYATKVEVEDPETGEDVEKMVLLGEFEKDGFEHESLMNAVPRRGIIFRGTLL
ncbi:MAG: hypothetical protein KAV87_26045 [Desulfobacteraceae bacterium]|nr:hypothetical protein [Desulfobacteraceae bacterium]